MRPLVSVIIPTLNEEKNLGPCLDAVFRQETDFEFEVLVVDSGSRDRTKAIAAASSQAHKLRLLEVRPGEFGHGKTRQFASEKAEGEFLVYLVADALPADGLWLGKLVEAARKDDRVAGAYSRQMPRSSAGVIEKIRLAQRAASKAAPRVTELGREDDYWMRSPLERILFCDFDDVSSLRRRSVLSKIPIPDCAWAEDLVWSKACLLAGYKIAFAPESAVYHSHELSARYLFKRGWIDQKAAGEHFGMVYYAGFAEALRGLLGGLGIDLKDIFASDASLGAKLAEAFRAPAYIGAEVLGRLLAEDGGETGYLNLIDSLGGAKVSPSPAQGRAARTALTIGDKWHRAILANPPAAIAFKLELPAQASFKFSLGIKPEAFKLRKSPIDFIINIDGGKVFNWKLEIAPENLKSWKDFTLDLERWSGKKVELSLITESPDTDYGWAAWAEPRIVSVQQSPEVTVRKYFAEVAAQALESGNFRHN